MEKRERELTEEREHLTLVQTLIQREMEQRLAELGVMKQDIVDYRKDLTEETLNEQTRLNNVDSKVKESQYRTAYQRVLELSRMYYAPYFGMICFREEGERDEESYYIGKRGLTQDGDPLILDWRTPAASLFYQQHLGKMSFRAPGGEIPVDIMHRSQ